MKQRNPVGSSVNKVNSKKGFGNFTRQASLNKFLFLQLVKNKLKFLEAPEELEGKRSQNSKLSRGFRVAHFVFSENFLKKISKLRADSGFILKVTIQFSLFKEQKLKVS